jgi:thiamine biosynthesis lipoprotein
MKRMRPLLGTYVDIARLNRQAWIGPVGVHPWTLRTLAWALLMHKATGGLFDCAVGHELAHRGLRDGCGLDEVELGTLRDVELRPDGTVRFGRRIGLDLGGIAKGFAVDRAIATLLGHGVRSAVVNAGGDLRVMGREPRPIHVRDSADRRRLQPIGLLRNGAVATSGVSELVLAHGCTPTVDARAYSVLAPRCVIADALTKALAQTGRTDAPWLARFGAVALITASAASTA